MNAVATVEFSGNGVIENPYLEEYWAIGGGDNSLWSDWGKWERKCSARRELVKKYSWAIPGAPALRVIASAEHVVEMGAGNGYWAHLLRRVGCDVIAFDAFERGEYGYTEERTWTHVQRGGPARLRKVPPCYALLLCWPPMNTMCERALRYFRGDRLFYVGEGDGGCTGTDRFHRMLRANWHLIDTFRIPQWDCINDELYCYTRRDK
jgi:hypothetical protein